MDAADAPGSGIGTTALGRLALRVLGEDGPEEVVKERRWPDMQSARAWCERIVDTTDPGTEIIEIQVFEEAWWHARSWERAHHRPTAEKLQLGMLDGQGLLRWGEPRSMTPHVADRLPI